MSIRLRGNCNVFSEKRYSQMDFSTAACSIILAPVI
jgi:hypothetical protein